MSTFSTLFGGESGQKFMLFTTSGIFTPPKPNTKVHVVCIGGGQGGSNSTGGADGGTSRFGELVSAAGGSTAWDNGKGPTSGCTGPLGFGSGGAGPYGSDHDGQYGANSNGGNCGNVATYSGTISTAQTVMVGAGGAGYVGGKNGKAGAVLVWYE